MIRTLTSRGMSRRAMLAVLASASAAAAGLPGRARAQTGGITFLTYGGIYGDNQRKAMVLGFEAASGISVNMVEGFDAVPALIGDTRQSAPSYDVIAFSDLEIRSVVEQGDLLAPIDAGAVPNVGDLPDEAKLLPGAVNIEFDPWGLMYRTDKMDPPTSWMDLFQPSIPPRRVAFQRPTPGSATFYNLLAAAVAAGGGIDDVETLGFPLIASLREQGAQFVDFSASLALAQNDGADIMPMYNNEAFFFADQGLPLDFVFPEEGVFPIGVWLGMPANLPDDRRAAAQAFIDHMIAPDPQVAMARLMYTGPTNVRATVDDDLRAKILLGADIDRAFPIDWDTFVSKQSEWLDLWNREIAG